ncbi:MAG: glycosyltransferase family 4 protein, partial [Candidatus Omnitrophica bacterium]|nr:glycosyltransferase family 4 protein [Candidatus Omnitrophota bacterium]
DRELAVMRKVDLVVSYNETEHAVILSHNLDSTKIAKWPWVVYPKEDIPTFEERQDIAFLGNYRHPPNVIAVEFFVKEVMPLLKRRIPDIRFLIYGANAPDEFKKLEAEGAILKGYVKNLDDVFKNIKVFVAPLLSGAGIKGKVLEALSYGVPSVLSPIAAEATGILNNFHAIIAENPKEWVDAIYNLYTNKELWERISKNAYEFAKSEYSFEKGRRLVIKALEMVNIYVPYENYILR